MHVPSIKDDILPWHWTGQPDPRRGPDPTPWVRISCADGTGRARWGDWSGRSGQRNSRGQEQCALKGAISGHKIRQKRFGSSLMGRRVGRVRKINRRVGSFRDGVTGWVGSVKFGWDPTLSHRFNNIHVSHKVRIFHGDVIALYSKKHWFVCPDQ